MTTILITGANRGIGLEHVRQSLAAGDQVIACCRAPDEATMLRRLLAEYGDAALQLESLDVGSGRSIEALAARLAGVPIDILIGNAGIYGPAPWPEGARLQTLEAMDYDFWEEVLRVNLLGAFRVVANLLANMLAGQRKLVVMMSSDLGSIAGNTVGQSHAYRSSKAALNMVTRGLAVELKNQGITVISLAPGWTQTDLGGTGATWPVAESVTAQRKVLAGVGLAESGQFIDLTGKIVPW